VLESAQLVAFMPTTNLTQAKAFYGTMLGLPMEGESPIAVTFDANGTTLRTVLVERFTPFPFTIVGWTVQDIAATVTELTARGVAFLRFDTIQQDPLGVWRSPGGARVAWFKDPFGNTISLTQF
jgi:predicted enzyme related to lactoylglutathione lyase